MDEIDAALDFRNVSIIAQYIKSQTRNAQFMIVSLRNNMFELADRLIGIYKTHNCTHSIAISPFMFTIKGGENKGAAEIPLKEEEEENEAPEKLEKEEEKPTLIEGLEEKEVKVEI